MLETDYLVNHPQSKIDLSRGAVQRASIADRFRRQIVGDSSHLEDGGLAVDALRLIRRDGLVENPDYHDIVNSDPVFKSVAQRLASVSGNIAKLAALDKAMHNSLGEPPGLTRLDGLKMTPAELAERVLGEDEWTEFDVAAGPPRVGPSDDPDARPETRVHYVSLDVVVDLIHRSLARGQAVVWGATDNHALLIYGADYDADGRPLAYWIKDSFAPYTYRAPAAEIHRRLTDVTVAEPAATPQAPMASRN
jgi:hypothetical protein